MKITIFTLLTIMLLVSAASAHRLWINVFESHAHKPPHAMVSLGWGHSLPMDDILTSTTSRVEIDSFIMLNPAMEKIELALPPYEINAPDTITADVDIYTADMASHKITLKEDSRQGVYQFGTISKPTFYTSYRDKKGRQRMQLKPLSEIDDLGHVINSLKYQAFAKSYLTVGSWSQPQPLGHGLEIIPRTDLSNISVGDEVEVDVLFYGKPLSVTAKSMDYIVAYSSSFGQSGDFFIGSYLVDGKAQFRVQSSGQWIIGIYHKDDVTPDGSLKDLVGKAQQVYHSATLTFNVK